MNCRFKAGPPKEDKFIVQFAEVPADSQAPFNAGLLAVEVIITIKAE